MAVQRGDLALVALGEPCQQFRQQHPAVGRRRTELQQQIARAVR
jgi:hypothetical protein